MTKIKDIKDLGENEVIHTSTPEECLAIRKILHDLGKTYSNRQSYLDLGYWDVYKENTCYKPYSGTWESLKYFKESGCTIHPASSFLPESFYQVEPKDEQPISERKAASFKFYDQLPEPLRTQAKENFDEGHSNHIPLNLADAIFYGWSWIGSKHGNFDSWDAVYKDVKNGKYKLSEASSVVDDTVKQELKQQSITLKEFVLLKDIDWFGKAIPSGTIYKQVNADCYHPMISGSIHPSMRIDFYTVLNNSEYFLELRK